MFYDDDDWRIYNIILKFKHCSTLSLVTYLIPYLSFPLRIYPLRFQAGGRKRQPNLGFFSCFSLLCHSIFVFLMHD